MDKNITPKKDYIQLLEEAPPEIQQIIRKVLKLEHEKLYQDKPRVQDDIKRIIQEEVR